MKRQMKWIAAALTALALTASAEEQVIWKLDGSNAEFSSKYSTKTWFDEKAAVPAVEKTEDGFLIKNHASHCLTLEPGTWLVVDLVKAEKIVANRYTCWSIYSFDKRCHGGFAGNVGQIPVGLYTIQITGLEKPVWTALRFYDYNLNLTFRYVKLVKNPENSLGAEIPDGKKILCPGDKFTIVLSLKDPCEDVTCKLMIDTGTGPRPFAINGTDTVELKPADKDGKIWKAEITLKDFARQKKPVDARAVRIKATVLGGKLETPIFGAIPASFQEKPEQ